MPSTPTGSIEFVAFHQPYLPDGEYVLSAKQQVEIDGTGYGWGEDPWGSAPSASLHFSVAGPRFNLDPGVIYSQFPPPNSTGEYYGALPHITFNRTTLAWERTIDNSAPSEAHDPIPWMALLLFDATVDGGALAMTNLTLQDLLHAYGQSATPVGQPEFIRILPWDSHDEPAGGDIKLEVGQHANDRLTVIDVPKRLLWQILPGEDDLPFLAHVRAGQSPLDPSQTAQYPVIFGNRLPAPGAPDDSGTSRRSTVHLISLESRKPLLDELLQTEPGDDGLVRFVSLASWSFSTLQQGRTFSLWIKEAWCPNADRNDLTTTSTCAGDIPHSLRMPVSVNANAERFLSQGYVPINHQTHQGNHLVSWYRSPLLPGPNAVEDLTLPIRTSDQLLRYFSDVGMFDATYAAAWELGRILTLRSSKISVSLFNWKRAHVQQTGQAEEAPTNLPFAPDYGTTPNVPADVRTWFSGLLQLRHVPFHYLVPREEMLPVNSLRFFTVDANWLECLIDGAFSIGRVSSVDVSRDQAHRNADLFRTAPACSGFILRSPVVSGWPDLGVEAYRQAISAAEAENYVPSVEPLKPLHMDHLGADILLCLFEGDIQTVDIHEYPDAIHFGVDVGNPNDIDTYHKQLRSMDGTPGNKSPQLPWKQNSSDKRTVNIAALAAEAGAANSSDFGVAMIQGVEKVRFIRQQSQA